MMIWLLFYDSYVLISSPCHIAYLESLEQYQILVSRVGALVLYLVFMGMLPVVNHYYVHYSNEIILIKEMHSYF